MTTWGGGLTVDQLEFSVAPAAPGARAFIVMPTLRPEHPAGPLSSPQDVIIRLRDDVAGTQVRCRVSALSGGVLQGAGESEPVVVANGGTVVCAVDLAAGPGGVGLPNGARCLDDRQCSSRFCVDGLCCDSRCDAGCMACDLPASPGLCAFVAAGTAPHDPSQCPSANASSCGGDGMCDGRGACRKHPVGTPCGDGRCEGATIVDAKACDGKGLCVSGPVATCAPFVCDAAARPAQCLTTCGSDADCVSGRRCENGSCGRLVAGGSCTDGAQCQSGFCADGVCCDSACDGPCLACNQPGSGGMCRPVAAGVPDPHGRCADSRSSDPASCGASGTCDAVGGCALYAAETLCGAAACSGTIVMSVMKAGTCDGVGVCVPGGTLRCNPYACKDGRCNAACAADGDCAPGQSCEVAAMSCGLKGLGQSCAASAACASGLCVDGVCCNEACDGPCRSCALASSMGVCKNTAAGAADPRGVCRATDPATCGADGACDGNGGCRKHPAGTQCAAETCSGSSRMQAGRCDAQGVCVPGGTVSCAPYACNGTACFASCARDADCVAPNVCLGGACGLRANGMACTLDVECGSGFCTDGVCCTSTDCGTCRACNLPGTVGRCAPVAALAAEPHGGCPDRGAASCGTDGTCNGAGACHVYAPGTMCGTATCTGTTLTMPSVCSAARTCVAGAQLSCAPFGCGAGACKTSCTTSADCAAPNQCMAGSCGPKPNGLACGGGGECASGNCLDGVCCASATCGACQACNVTGRAGTCQPVAAGVPDPRGVCAVQPTSGCGRSGLCDGSGGCAVYTAGTLCAPATCAGNLVMNAGTCDGGGSCSPGSTGANCAPYACRAGACLGSCSTDADCVTPATCNGSVCRKRALGAACAAAAECDSDSCVDGVCCASSACAACQACNVPGFLGACANVAAGAADPHTRCAAAAPATCGLDGVCDGAGACRQWTAGTVCLPAVCSMKKRSQNPQTCDGAGACVPRGIVNCAPDDCDTTTGLCP